MARYPSSKDEWKQAYKTVQQQETSHNNSVIMHCEVHGYRGDPKNYDKQIHKQYDEQP